MTNTKQLTESQEQSLDSVYVAILPLHIEHKPKDTRQCRWHIVDSVGGIVECFQSEEKATEAMARVTAYWS
jgi:hypothetical protein